MVEPIKRDPLTFLGELKRRRVGRVLLLYLATSFAVVEAADIVLAALSQPDWMLQVLKLCGQRSAMRR